MVNVKGYKEHVFNLVPSLTVLDGYNKNGEEVFSESDDDDYGAYDEDGEDDLDNDFITENLSEEQLAELKRRGISIKDYLEAQADGQNVNEEDGESDQEDGESDQDDFGEDGESDQDSG